MTSNTSYLRLLKNNAKKNHPGNKFGRKREFFRSLLKIQDALHADETGWRKGGDNYWLWSFSNEQISYYRIDKSRGTKVVTETLGEQFSGVLVSDCYGAYNLIECRKQKCWAHFFRDIRRAREEYPMSTQPGEFDEVLHRFFRQAKHLKQRCEQGEEIQKPLTQLKSRTLTFLECRTDETSTPWIFRLRKLRKRMLRHVDALYTFVTEGVDPTNNPAEREVRPAVLMRKTSYGNRSDQGSCTQAILMSIQRTCLKQGISYPNWAAAQFI